MESVGFTKIFRIPKSEFLGIIKDSPKEQEVYFAIKDQFTHGSPSNLQCYICRSGAHLAKNCKLTHYVPDLEKLIKQQNYPLFQERGKEKAREKTRQPNTLAKAHQLSMTIQDFMNDQESEKLSSQSESNQEDEINPELQDFEMLNSYNHINDHKSIEEGSQFNQHLYNSCEFDQDDHNPLEICKFASSDFPKYGSDYQNKQDKGL